MNIEKIESFRFFRDEREKEELCRELSTYKEYLRTTVDSLVAHKVRIHRSSGMKLSPHFTPRIFSLLEDTQRKLGTNFRFDVYCNNDETINGEISRNGERSNNCSLFINSGTLELLTDSELMFILGHELGHLIFEHDLLHTFFHFYHFGKAKVLVPFSSKCKYLRWRPASEITADRVGLYLCGDLRSACSAILKAGLGLSEKNLNTNLSALFEFIEDDFTANEVTHNNRSHPLIPIRLISIKYFWEWYCSDENSESSSKKNLDSKVELLMRTGYKEAENEVEKAILTLLATKGLELIEADSKVLDVELNTLIYTLFDNFTLTPENFIEWDKTKRKTKIDQAVKIINEYAAEDQKRFLLAKFIDIATCDKVYSREEDVIINQVANSIGLHFDPSFVN